VDDIQRVFAYKLVGDLPLVMVTGFSEADVQAGVSERSRWLLAGTLTVVVVILFLAILLTVEIRRRNEQNSFMSMLSHELKTPLSVLRMSLDGSLSARTRQHAQKSIQDLDAIVERCLQVDRLQQQRYLAQLQSCDLSELLSECRDACDAPQRLVITTIMLPVFTVDTQMLRMVLSNLIDNALKYAAPASPVPLTVTRQLHKAQPGILISIDNLPGTAGKPDPRQVFKKYYRSPGARRKTGSGLGLYLVHNVARQLGGWVRYVPDDSRVRFEFWLPT
jgi:signal transduction histidine kinase